MSPYYDVIMKSGYYDYEKIVDSLLIGRPINKVLEIGCGTGLILEELATRQSQASICGFDLTESMLTIARERLQKFPNVSVSQQNVCQLQMDHEHELAFSYGGVWYFVIDGDKEPFLVSHIPADEGNHQGFQRLARCVSKGGTLLLGIQGPHRDYETEIHNGMKYSQKIEPGDRGFTKHYYLADGGRTVMAQTLLYRTYSFTEARDMMSEHGFEYAPDENRGKFFLGFKKLR
jgi:SAM-dependent methyltransferase